MENQLTINAVLNTPWLIALLPCLFTTVAAIIRKLSSPLTEDISFHRECGISPLLLKLSFSRKTLVTSQPYKKRDYYFYSIFSALVFVAAGSLTYYSTEPYRESPKGWALLRLISTDELFLISLNEARSPDNKTWTLSPQTCLTKTYEDIAKEIDSSNALASKLCRSITIKNEEKTINEWIIKVHNGIFKIIIFFTPILIALYWVSFALILDVLLKKKIDKYNALQVRRAENYLT